MPAIVPFYKQLKFKILILILLIICSIILPAWIIMDGDYKALSDRLTIQRELFFSLFENSIWKYNALDSDSSTPPPSRDEIFTTIPSLIPGQRIIMFNYTNGEISDSGLLHPYKEDHIYDLYLPHPYVRNEYNSRYDTKSYYSALEKLQKEYQADVSKKKSVMLNVQTSDGMDRMIVHARNYYLTAEDFGVLVMMSSVVDILKQTRAVKERYLFLFLVLLSAAIVLAFILNKTVIHPFYSLHAFSKAIINEQKNPDLQLPRGGEIGQICQSISRLLHKQQSITEKYRSFSSDVIHELKTPLTAIKTAIELLQESTSPEETQMLSTRIHKRIGQMESLMSDTYILNQLESSSDAGYSCIDIAPILADFQREYSQVDFKFPDSAVITLSEKRFKQVLENLLSNALSFPQKTQGVSVSVFVKSTQCILKVEDHGPGIPEEIINDICKRYFSYRSDQSAPTHSGIGLAIVSEIMSSCNGKLEYNNKKEGGALFRCSFPAKVLTP